MAWSTRNPPSRSTSHEVPESSREVARSTRRRSSAVVVVAGAALVAACSGGGSGVETIPPVSTTATTADGASGTTVVPTSADAPEDSVVTSEPAPPPESTSAPAAAPETTTTTTSPPTTTTEPLSVQELVLRTDGIGSARFGADPEGVISYVTSILGGNTGDTGWVDPFTFAACQGTVARQVDWGVLSLQFTDLSSFASDRRHFVAYEYGRVGEIGDEPVGLRTPGGVTLGSRVVDLLAEFPEARINPAEPEINVPDNFYVSDVFIGLLTGTEQDDVVTVILAGDGCGE